MTAEPPSTSGSVVAGAEPEPGQGPAGPRYASSRRSRSRPGIDAELSARLAWWVFVAYLVVAVPLVLFVYARHLWFLRDEWIFLTGRGLSFHSLFGQFDGHWVTLPILSYKVLYRIFGVHSYLPYLATLLALHLAAVVLLRIVMRRAGVGPWIATVAAGSFVLFGPGAQNILWAFQIAFVGALVFGLGQLILSDHDGPIDRRDWLALASGGAALMFSGVAPVMVVVVGLSTLWRRGWRASAFQTAPLAAVYGLWYVWAKPDPTGLFGWPSVSAVVAWVRQGETGVFVGLGHFGLIGLALAVLVVVGLAVAWIPLGYRGSRLVAGPTAALLVGSLLFSAASSIERWYFGAEVARSSRYLYIGAAMVLPAVAVAADAIARRWRILTPVVLAMLLVGLAWNTTTMNEGPFNNGYFSALKTTLLGAPTMPYASQVPTWVRPDPDVFVGKDLTIGWLLQARKAGRLPAPPAMSPSEVASFRVRLGVAQTDRPSSSHCTTRKLFRLQPKLGQSYGIATPVKIATRVGKQRTSDYVAFNPANGHTLNITLSGLRLLVAPVGLARTVTLCS